MCFLSINQWFFFCTRPSPNRKVYLKKKKVLWSKHDMTVGVRTDPGSGVMKEKCVCEQEVTGWNAAFQSSSRCAGWQTLLMISVTYMSGYKMHRTQKRKTEKTKWKCPVWPHVQHGVIYREEILKLLALAQALVLQDFSLFDCFLDLYWFYYAVFMLLGLSTIHWFDSEWHLFSTK